MYGWMGGSGARLEDKLWEATYLPLPSYLATHLQRGESKLTRLLHVGLAVRF